MKTLKKVRDALILVAILMIAAWAAGTAMKTWARAGGMVDNPPQHVKEERTIKQARVDVYHHEPNTYCKVGDNGEITCQEEIDTWQPCQSGENDLGDCQ